MSAKPTTLEGRLAQLIRLACSNHEGEAIAAMHAIVRTLKAAGANDVHALADRIEKPNGSSLSETEMRKLYDAGYRRHHAMLPRSWHPQLPVGSKTRAWPHGCGSHQDF
jgi:hypothetical protein